MRDVLLDRTLNRCVLSTDVWAIWVGDDDVKDDDDDVKVGDEVDVNLKIAGRFPLPFLGAWSAA